MPPYKRAALGISRTFQNIALVTNATVLDNLMAARHNHMKSNMLTGALFWGPAQREEITHRRRVEEIIDFLELENIRKSIVGTLSYGLRKRVELGRALALEPSLLLLDEPMAGMNIEEKEDVARYILDIHELQGTTIMLIEHDISLVMDFSQHIAVIDFGVKIGEGTPGEISQNEAVIAAYLGEGSISYGGRQSRRTHTLSRLRTGKDLFLATEKRDSAYLARGRYAFQELPAARERTWGRGRAAQEALWHLARVHLE